MLRVGCVVVVLVLSVSGAARADVPPRDRGDCSKVGAACELDGRPGKCQTKTRIQRLPKPGGGTTTRERQYIACVPTGPAKKVEASAVEAPTLPALPPEPEPVTPEPVTPEPVTKEVAAPVAVAPVVEAPVVTPEAPAASGGMCRVAPEGPGLALLGLVLLRRRRR